MTWTLLVRPEAEQDLAEAFEWYERQRPGLGDELLLRVEAATESICHDPRLCGCIHRDVRRKLVRRFPYGVFYVRKNGSLATPRHLPMARG